MFLAEEGFSKAIGDHAPLGYFAHPGGAAATSVLHLTWVLTAVVSLVTVLVALLILVSIFRRRGENDASPEASLRGERWIFIGTGLSAFVLALLTVYMLTVLIENNAPPSTPTLTITVTGYDWWWKASYEGEDGKASFDTANEIHIPVGQPVMIKLQSADVIHAFWVPALAGKTQTIPGQTNHQWLMAERPGVYWGQCTQFCGVQHAHMAFTVVAETPAEFDKWRAHEAANHETSRLTDSSEGSRDFVELCGGCHKVRGSEANGTHGPDLTHLETRSWLGAGTLPNTAENLAAWIGHVQEIKPGARMPNFDLSPAENSALAAYLASLK